MVLRNVSPKILIDIIFIQRKNVQVTSYIITTCVWIVLGEEKVPSTNTTNSLQEINLCSYTSKVFLFTTRQI